MSTIKLICFDLDDTLIRDIHSVMYLSILNNKYEELIDIERRELKGEYDWIEADYYKARLAEGLPIEQIQNKFNSVLKPLKNIEKVVEALHQKEIQCILITAGPIQVAEVACKLWGMDACWGSDYEVIGDRFTGKILNHLGDKGKLEVLKKYCLQQNIYPQECIAFGDGATDIPLFEYCGDSIGINCSQAVAKKAKHFITTNDLKDILSFIKLGAEETKI